MFSQPQMLNFSYVNGLLILYTLNCAFLPLLFWVQRLHKTCKYLLQLLMTVTYYDDRRPKEKHKTTAKLVYIYVIILIDRREIKYNFTYHMINLI